MDYKSIEARDKYLIYMYDVLCEPLILRIVKLQNCGPGPSLKKPLSLGSWWNIERGEEDTRKPLDS